MSEPDDAQHITCYDCERQVPHRHTRRVETPIHHDDGLGYDMIPVPVCDRCRLKRRGHACEHCGQLHADIEAADRCCVGASKAPRCPECSRRMERGSWGYGPDGGMTVDWAECEACGIGWGAWSGFHELDEEDGEDD